MEEKIRRKIPLYGIAAVLLAILFFSMVYNLGEYLPDSDQPEPPSPEPPSPTPTSDLLNTFSSYEELRNFLINNSGTSQAFPYLRAMWGLGRSTLTSGIDVYFAPSDLEIEYSTTNIQVAGVDEIDIVKTDGNHIYLLSGNDVVIMEAYPPEGAELLSKITFNDTSPIGMFVSGDRLAVIGYQYANPYLGYYGYLYPDAKTFVNIYDISNRTDPTFLRDFIISGNYFNSRMIGEYVYFIVSQSAQIVNETVILPRIYSEKDVKEIGATTIQYFNTSGSYYIFTTIVAMNIQDIAEEPTNKTILLSGASCMYVSLNNIYITSPSWETPYLFVDDVGGKTLICRIQIENDTIEAVAEGEVPGYVLNQFSMDEHSNHFRIATTTGHVARTLDQATSTNQVYVLDMNLNIVGRLENLAPGEEIYSARFMGDRCYLVTFKKVDPLFVIDLSEPTDPTVLGKLKIPGYSDYLHPYDENHIIGIGKHTVEADEGDFAWYQGVKISLFDVSNVNDPQQIANYTIGDRGTDSPVLRDHKAFLFGASKNLLVIPVQVAEIDETQYPDGVPPNAYGTLVWQGAYVFNITLSDGLVLRGNITHQDENTSVWESSYWVNRALYIEDALYTISNEKVKVNNLEDLSLIKEIELP